MSDFQRTEGRAGSGEGTGASDELRMESAVPKDFAVKSNNAAPSFAPDELVPYAPAAWDLIPLKGASKVPLSNWRSRSPLTSDQAKQCFADGSNVGVRLSTTDLVVDVDPRAFRDGIDSFAKLQRDIGFDFAGFPTVQTGGGGLHIYMRKPADLLIAVKLAGYPGIDFKREGGFVVAAGSVHPATGQTYTWDPLAGSLFDVSDAPASLLTLLRVEPATSQADAGSHTPAQLAAMLTGLKVEDYRDQGRWLDIMMACHHATGGEGREEFIAWSVADPEYCDHADKIGQRWDSLSTGGERSITERTLFKHLHLANRGDLIPRTDAADDFPDDLDLPATTDSQPAKFEDQWVWVGDSKEFFRRSDGKGFMQDVWRSLHAHRLPEGDIVSSVFKGRVPIRKFESLVYVPGLAEMPKRGPHRGMYNIWRSAELEPKPGDVQPFLEHMSYLFPDETDRELVLDYLTLLVTKPSLKFKFALLVRGAQGTGKSWLGYLLERVIGSANVSRPSNEEIRKDWGYWLRSTQLAVVEELMAVGRMEVANKLKPIITEPQLRIELKGGAVHSIPNHMNLICFTNFPDALPLERDDRRWLVVFSPAQRRGPEYYDRLFGYPAAPMTVGKEEMLRLSLDDVEDHIRDMVDEGVAPFDHSLFRLEELLERLPGRLLGRRTNLKKKAVAALRNIGAVRYEDRYTKGDHGRPAYILWSIRDHAKWSAAGAAARIDAFMAREG